MSICGSSLERIRGPFHRGVLSAFLRSSARISRATGLGLVLLVSCDAKPSGTPGTPGGPADAAGAHPLAVEGWQVMGTYAAVRVPQAEASGLAGWAASTKRVFGEVNATLSSYLPESEVSRLGREAGKEAVPVSPRTLEILRISARYHEITGGVFEPTLGPLIRKWGFSGGSAPAKPLDPETVKQVLSTVGMRHVSLGEGKAFLELPGMSIDLGGIAKGYAVDLAWEEATRAGARNLIVDLGGNLRCLGTNGARAWTVGVRNPFEKEGLVGILRLPDGLATATSGNYEQFIELDGVRYTHIIDPRTGFPTRGMAGVTVVSPTATEADALSTALFILGPEEGQKTLERCPGSRALWIPDRQPIEILVGRGLEGIFEPASEYAGAVKPLAR